MNTGAERTAGDGPGTRRERARSVGWLGAVVLLVFLAAAGVPDAGCGIGSTSHTESVDRAHRAGASVAELVARAVHAPCSNGPIPAPRVLPRARSVRDSGLPQPRAPTA